MEFPDEKDPPSSSSYKGLYQNFLIYSSNYSLTVFWCFRGRVGGGVEKGCTGSEWLNNAILTRLLNNNIRATHNLFKQKSICFIACGSLAWSSIWIFDVQKKKKKIYLDLVWRKVAACLSINKLNYILDVSFIVAFSLWKMW